MEPVTVHTSQRQLLGIALLSASVTLILSAGVLFLAKDFILTAVTEAVTATLPTVTPVASDSDRVVETIAQVNDAVVSVVVTKDVPIYERYFERFDGNGWFGDFLIPRVRENGTREEEVGGGSGFIVSPEGLVVTNRHVVEDETARYSVVFSDGAVLEADVLARDSQLDVAILKISAQERDSFPYLSFGDSDMLQPGQTVIAIGNALAEFQNSVSVGVISGLSRSIVASDNAGRSETLEQVIQTDAAINPGNSGGPLLNLSGEVIGVNVATSRGADNIGFALPSRLVEQVVRSVSEHGEIRRPYLGVYYQMITPEVAEEYSLSVTSGALIISTDSTVPAIVPDSPAARAGLQENDVITAIDGQVMIGTDLATMLRTREVGETVVLTVRRGDKDISITVTLEKAV